MKDFTVDLNNIERVKKFVKIAMSIPTDVIVTEGKYTIDGKSLMGLFSLDLSRPVSVHVSEAAYTDEFNEFII